MGTATYHPGITQERILEAGLELGLEELSVSAAAKRLGVSAPAIYRHVASREALDELVGEHLLTAVRLDVPVGPPRDPDPRLGAPDPRAGLMHLARTLFELCMSTPGMARYLHQGIPRGPESARLEAEAAALLLPAGFEEPVARLLSSTVATLAISLSYAETHHTAAGGGRDLASQVTRLVGTEARLTALDRLTLTMGPCIDGLLAAIRPGADLAATLHRLKEAYL